MIAQQSHDINRFVSYKFSEKFGKPNVSIEDSSILFQYPCKSRNNCSYYEVELKPAKYRFQCWGASANNGMGAYTSGLIDLKSSTKFFLYIGASNGYYNSVPLNTSFESGDVGSGSTDIRLVKGEFHDFESLKSRIMVAASAGSGEQYKVSYTPAHGGALYSDNVTITGIFNYIALGATQTSSPIKTGQQVRGTFGIAGYVTDNSDWGGTGGNGYYAGISATNTGSGTGGSSFISGHIGCDAISNASTGFDNIIHTGQPVHYSNLSFSFTEMIDGSRAMPKPTKYPPTSLDDYEIGHQGHGFIRISLIEQHYIQTICYCSYNFQQKYLILCILIDTS